MIKRLLLIVPLGVTTLLTGCAIPPEYAEPLAALEKKDSPLSPLTLGIFLSENTQKALDYLAEDTRLTRVNPAVIDDQDPRAVSNGLYQILGNRFKNVVLLKTLELPSADPVDLVMVADVQIILGPLSGTTTSVDLVGIFTEPNRQIIETIKAKGSATVPFPASHRRFRVALNSALAEFAKSLDTSVRLREFALSALMRPKSPASR